MQLPLFDDVLEGELASKTKLKIQILEAKKKFYNEEIDYGKEEE